MATKSDVADVRSEVHSLRADVASDLINLEERIDERLKAQEKRLSDQISGLRRSVMEYHSSQIGHGVLLTEFEERLRRLEEHVGTHARGALRLASAAISCFSRSRQYKSQALFWRAFFVPSKGSENHTWRVCPDAIGEPQTGPRTATGADA